jgi:hypothetical protein
MARTAAGSLLVVTGLAAMLLGLSLVAFGLAGLFFGMHGGRLSALILAVLGLGPGFIGYALARKGLRLARDKS